MSMSMSMSEDSSPLIPTNPRTRGAWKTPTAFRYRTHTQSASYISLTHPATGDQVQYGSEGRDGLTDLEDVLQYRYYCIANDQ